MNTSSTPRRIYMDANATTPMDERVFQAMTPFFMEKFGNPNSLHTHGTEVHDAMRKAMDQLYAGINANEEDDVIITACATESNNTVIKTAYYELVQPKIKTQIITSTVEHPTVTKTCEFVASLGADVVYVPVNTDGIVTPEALEKVINKEGKCALVSIMWANNETGLIMPIKELCAVAKKYGALFHSDAVQAIGKVPVDVQDIGLDYLSFSAHKFHGPKGIGALYVKNGAPLTPFFHGGEQMGGRRAGTVNVPYLVGMGLAMELAVKNLSAEGKHVRVLRDKLEEAIKKIPEAYIIGRHDLRTPNTILASFRGVEGEALLWDLNKNGVSASTGSACASESLETSPTFVAMNIQSELSHTALRLSLSRENTEQDVDDVIRIVTAAVARLRSISGFQFTTCLPLTKAE